MPTLRINNRNQITVPADIQAALGVAPGGAIGWVVEGGQVSLVPVSAPRTPHPGERTRKSSPEGGSSEA